MHAKIRLAAEFGRPVWFVTTGSRRRFDHVGPRRDKSDGSGVWALQTRIGPGDGDVGVKSPGHLSATGYTLSTSWLITLTAILPDFGGVEGDGSRANTTSSVR